MSWASIKESRTLTHGEYLDWPAPDRSMWPHKLLFVSHRWNTAEHPDPDGRQLRELQQRLKALNCADDGGETAYVFYDYSSMPQRPRTPEEDAVFYRGIESLRGLSQAADRFVILSEGYRDYKNRAWCFFELVVANQQKLHLFHDQRNIEADIAFKSNLMAEAVDLEATGLITTEKLSYQVNFGESEVIVAAFQHLRSCRATHSEDIPLIRLELARHFNSREMTAYGRLVTALAKFFDVDFLAVSTGSKRSGRVVCKPYFEEDDWKRLPVPGRRERSKFAVPGAKYRELSEGFVPMLRLTLPGVSDFTEFLQRFRKERKWKDHVVPAARAAFKDGEDCFPTIDYVIHTVLERPPGFLLGPQCVYMPIIPDLEGILAAALRRGPSTLDRRNE